MKRPNKKRTLTIQGMPMIVSEDGGITIYNRGLILTDDEVFAYAKYLYDEGFIKNEEVEIQIVGE